MAGDRCAVTGVWVVCRGRGEGVWAFTRTGYAKAGLGAGGREGGSVSG